MRSSAAVLALFPLLAATSAASLVCRLSRLSHHPIDEPQAFNVEAAGGRLSWSVELPADAPRGQTQVAYSVVVTPTDDAANHGGWSSGIVNSTSQRVVTGALAAGATHSWKVSVWLSGEPHREIKGCVQGLRFDTAPDAQTFPGPAQWIGGGGQLRSKSGLVLPAGAIRRARLYVTGLGSFYAFVNGKRVGQNVMDPPQTVYSKTVGAVGAERAGFRVVRSFGLM